MNLIGKVQNLMRLQSTVKIFKKEENYMEENKQSVHFTSKSQTWNTPPVLFNQLNDLWKFTLDVACLPDSALCEKFFTPDDNGLEQNWGNEICWMNPPYNDIKTWTKKAVDAYNKGATVVTLIPARTDTQACQNNLFPHASITCFIKGRLKFDNPSNDGTHQTLSSAPFPSMLVVLDKNLTTEKIEYLKSIGIAMVLA